MINRFMNFKRWLMENHDSPPPAELINGLKTQLAPAVLQRLPSQYVGNRGISVAPGAIPTGNVIVAYDPYQTDHKHLWVVSGANEFASSKDPSSLIVKVITYDAERGSLDFNHNVIVRMARKIEYMAHNNPELGKILFGSPKDRHALGVAADYMEENGIPEGDWLRKISRDFPSWDFAYILKLARKPMVHGEEAASLRAQWQAEKWKAPKFVPKV